MPPFVAWSYRKAPNTLALTPFPLGRVGVEVLEIPDLSSDPEPYPKCGSFNLDPQP